MKLKHKATLPLYCRLDAVIKFTDNMFDLSLFNCNHLTHLYFQCIKLLYLWMNKLLLLWFYLGIMPMIEQWVQYVSIYLFHCCSFILLSFLLCCKDSAGLSLLSYPTLKKVRTNISFIFILSKSLFTFWF